MPALRGHYSRQCYLRHQLVAAGLGNQQLSLRGVLLDLLPQPINMSLECVRGDASVVSPHLMQQHVARDHPLAGAIEIFEDRRLFLGEPDLAAIAVDQQLERWPEGVRPDSEDGI